jgi:hypothetical protein
MGEKEQARKSFKEHENEQNLFKVPVSKPSKKPAFAAGIFGQRCKNAVDKTALSH